MDKRLRVSAHDGSGSSNVDSYPLQRGQDRHSARPGATRRSPSSVRTMTGLARAVRTVVRTLPGRGGRRGRARHGRRPLRTSARRCAARPRTRGRRGARPDVRARERRRRAAAADRRRARRRRRLHRADLALALAHAGAQGGDRRRRPRRHDADASPPTCSPASWTSTSTSCAARSRAVADLLSAADEAHVTCPRGTDLRLDLSGREGIADDGDLTAPGAFGNLPVRRGLHRAGRGRGHGRDALAGLASGSSRATRRT